MAERKFQFFDGNEVMRAGVDLTVWTAWLAEMEKEDPDPEYVQGYPVYRVRWYDAGDDECTNYFDVISSREMARMISLVEQAGMQNIIAIDVVLIKVTKEP